MEIKRNHYLNILISKKNNGLIKVITGMRRCGKSYLLFTLFKEYLLKEGVDEKHIIEIAFDTLLMASNNISFLIVNFIFIPSFLLFIIVIITVEKVKNPLFSLFYNKI